jgi:hypothetical protein
VLACIFRFPRFPRNTSITFPYTSPFSFRVLVQYAHIESQPLSEIVDDSTVIDASVWITWGPNNCPIAVSQREGEGYLPGRKRRLRPYTDIPEIYASYFYRLHSTCLPCYFYGHTANSLFQLYLRIFVPTSGFFRT